MTPETATQLLTIISTLKEELEKYVKALTPTHDHPDVQFDSEDKLLPPAHGKWAAPELTRDKVPEGMRPYLYGEKLRKGDIMCHLDSGTTLEVYAHTESNAEKLFRESRWWAFTRDPLPPKSEPEPEPKPEPEPVLMTVDDLPPVVWLLDTCGGWHLVYAVKENGDLDIRFSRGDISWFHKNGFQWSPDRKNPQSFLKA